MAEFAFTSGGSNAGGILGMWQGINIGNGLTMSTDATLTMAISGGTASAAVGGRPPGALPPITEEEVVDGEFLTPPESIIESEVSSLIGSEMASQVGSEALEVASSIGVGSGVSSAGSVEAIAAGIETIGAAVAGAEGAMAAVASASGPLVVALAALLAIIFPVLTYAHETLAHKNWKFRTTVDITIGAIGPDPSNSGYAHDVNQGGSLPHLTLWAEDMRRVGFYQGDEDAHLNKGDWHTVAIRNEPDANLQATYLAVHMQESDAVCIAHIRVHEADGLSYDWLGDVVGICGGPWYFNSVPSNNMGHTPKCAWLDSDRSLPAFKYAAMGIHLPDFVPTPRRALQYTRYPETLCASAPRFQMYPNFAADDTHVFYKPPLRYNSSTLEDHDLGRVAYNHGDANGHKRPKFDFMYKGAPHFLDNKPPSSMNGEGSHNNAGQPLAAANGTEARDPNPPTTGGLATDVPTGSNNTSNTSSHQQHQSRSLSPDPHLTPPFAYHPSHVLHLVSSDHTEHSARHLCSSATSVGPDFVSHIEELFCDMEHKQTWPLCDGRKRVKDACFDYQAKEFRPPSVAAGGSLGRRDFRTGREVPLKRYESENEWKTGGLVRKVTFGGSGLGKREVRAGPFYTSAPLKEEDFETLDDLEDGDDQDDNWH